MSQSGQFLDAIRAGDRAALARAITLVESSRSEDRIAADLLLNAAQSFTGKARRIGITGIPGVGKSSFLDALGLQLCQRGLRVAVLAIDPSSRISGGSLLGDKTRMTQLAREPGAFVRPSPGGTTLGGIAEHTREAILLCDVAGFDVVFVETIGVGQGETAVYDVVDCCVLLLLATAGDELQGLKRGIMELADLVVIHKADRDPVGAQAARLEFERALALLRAAASPKVVTASAASGEGIGEVWQAIDQYWQQASATAIPARRQRQNLTWFDATVASLALARVQGDQHLSERLQTWRQQVAAGQAHPMAAARAVFTSNRG